MPPRALTAAKLVPELYCTHMERSLCFYVDVLGFAVLYSRPEESFVYLGREGAELMLEEPRGRVFLAGPLQYPYGRGINLQIEVSKVAELFVAVERSRSPIVLPLEDKWYRRDDIELGNRQFIVQDPDGYLLRFFQSLGSRPRGALQ
jgi:catechol 2,3-dioxygenase-like lactoylglutathione lyase family enzyme